MNYVLSLLLLLPQEASLLDQRSARRRVKTQIASKTAGLQGGDDDDDDCGCEDDDDSGCEDDDDDDNADNDDDGKPAMPSPLQSLPPPC